MRTVFFICASLFLLTVAAALRVTFAREVLRQYAELPSAMVASQRYGFWTPDSAGYVQPAQQIAQGNLLAGGSLSRPPGYPFFLWLSNIAPHRILFTQALFGSLIPVCTFLLTYSVVANLPISFCAGLISCVSPTGIGITGLVLADLTFATLFALGMLLLARSAMSQSTTWAIGSALLFGTAGLVKPILLGWPALAVVVYGLLARVPGSRVRWTPALPLVLVPTLFFVGWAACNHLRDGVFTVSEIGLRTVRLYLAVRVEEQARTDKEPSPLAMRMTRTRVEDELHKLGASERMRAYLDAVPILWTHPAATITVFFRNVSENMEGGWDHFSSQLPLTTLSQPIFVRASQIEAHIRHAARWPVSLALLIFPLGIAFQTAEARRWSFWTVALWFVYAYFALSSGITFWVGPRLLYPVEMIAIVILTTEMALVAHAVRRFTVGLSTSVSAESKRRSGGP